MKCHHCKEDCLKKGFQSNGIQKYYCKQCKKYQKHQQATYIKKAFHPGINSKIIRLVKESCGILSISRILDVSPTTVISRIKQIAKQINPPVYISIGKEYEVDELKTYIKKKKQGEYWVGYALQKDTKEVVDFRVGKRTNKTLRPIITTLLLSEATKIYTDKLPNYKTLIPKKIHRTRKYYINHIERKNFDLRTHLKRLNRKTICYSKNLVMLSACLKIYFWG